jgi:cytochrome P450
VQALLDVMIAAAPSRTRDLRRALTRALARDVPRAYVEDAVLVVNELVTAAVLNGSGPFHILVERAPSYIRAAVTDRGGRLPQRLLQPDNPAGAVAFRIVETAADSWGIAHLPAETVLWAKILVA